MRFRDCYDPMIITWETETAKFVHIEISSSHIFNIKIDKVTKKKKEEVG